MSNISIVYRFFILIVFFLFNSSEILLDKSSHAEDLSSAEQIELRQQYQKQLTTFRVVSCTFHNKLAVPVTYLLLTGTAGARGLRNMAGHLQ